MNINQTLVALNRERKHFSTLLIFMILFFLPFKVLTAATMPSPSTDPNFSYLPNGQKLSDIKVKGQPLRLIKGTGKTFTTKDYEAYLQLKKNSQTKKNYPVQWVFLNLDTKEIISSSLSYQFKIFGASASKIFIAGTLLDKQTGYLNSDQLQQMANMLVVSSNEAWLNLQKQIGDGVADKGRERVHSFTQAMGYLKTRAYQGTWNNKHGNELTAYESALFLYDTFHNHYPGAEYLWKLMHTCRTGGNRGLRFLPTKLFVGGKTGSYSGTSVDPETGSDKTKEGKPFRVSVYNHFLVFNYRNHQYGLTVLANSGSDEAAALLAGGLWHEYLK